MLAQEQGRVRELEQAPGLRQAPGQGLAQVLVAAQAPEPERGPVLRPARGPVLEWGPALEPVLAREPVRVSELGLRRAPERALGQGPARAPALPQAPERVLGLAPG